MPTTTDHLAYRNGVIAEFALDLVVRETAAAGRTADAMVLRTAHDALRCENYLAGLDLPLRESIAIREVVKAQLGWTPVKAPRYLPATFRNQRRQSVGAL